MGDMKAEDLKKALDLEKRGQGFNRGLVEQDHTALQTFELIIPLDMREVFDEVSVRITVEYEIYEQKVKVICSKWKSQNIYRQSEVKLQ